MESAKYTCTCGKEFVHNSSLCKHRKKCKQYNEAKECVSVTNKIEPSNDKINADNALLKQLMEDQEERHQQYVEQQEERHQKYVEQQEERHQIELKRQEDQYQKYIQEQEDRHTRDIQIIEKEHARELKEQEQQFERMKTEMEDRINFIKKMMEEQVAFYKNASTAVALTPVPTPTTAPAPKKSPTIKEYLAEKKPVSIEAFMSNYIPKAHEYTNILNVGAIDAISINFSNYLQTYAQEQYPIVISNSQTARLRIYIYTTEWIKYELHNAHKQLNDIIIRFVNKYIKHIAVFNEMYPKCTVETPSLHPDCEDDIIKKTRLTRSLYQIDDTEAHKIVNQLVNYFIIKKHVDDE